MTCLWRPRPLPRPRLFRWVLNYANHHKDPAAREQNMVMGLRMGGLIARCKRAFRYMPGKGVTIRATSPSGSPCGLAGQFTFTASRSGYRMAATPNPSSSDLAITAGDEDQPTTSATAPPFKVELYDNHGWKVKTGKSKRGKAQLDVRELPAGLYNVRAGTGKRALSQHLEITH